MKSKEPKQPKKEKSEAKSGKSSDKGKRLSPAPLEPQQSANVTTSDGALHAGANGAAAPHPVVELDVTDVYPPLDLIRRRAYELFAQRGYEHGRHLDDWLAAERELKTKNRAA